MGLFLPVGGRAAHEAGPQDPGCGPRCPGGEKSGPSSLAGNRPTNGMALSLAASHYLDFAERRFARKTYQYKKMILKKFVEHLGDREMEEIQPVQVQEFLLTRPSNHNFNVARKEISTFGITSKTMNLPVRQSLQGHRPDARKGIHQIHSSAE